MCDGGLLKACDCLKIYLGIHVLVSMRRSVNMVTLGDSDLVRAFRAGSVWTDAGAINEDQER